MSNAVLSYDHGTLILSGVEEKQKLPFVWDQRISSWRCDGVDYVRVRDGLQEEHGSSFVDEVTFPERIVWPENNLPKLREEQEKAVAAWVESNCRGMIIMPTGTGKTVVAFAAMQRVRASTLVVAPVRDLMYQWHQRLQTALGYDAGIIGDGINNLRPVTVTTYDSAYIHMAEIGSSFELIIFDEAHHLPGKSRREAALLCAAPLRMGLTATPERLDGGHRQFEHLIGPEVYRLDISKARGNSLADYQIVRIPVSLKKGEQAIYDESSLIIRRYMNDKRKEDKTFTWQKLMATVADDPEARIVQKAFYRKQSIEDRAEEKLRVLEDIFRLHLGERIIIFAGSNAMAFDVSRRFLVPTILSHSRKQERQKVLAGFTEGSFPILVANQVLDEGVDVPEAKVAVIIGGHTSTRQTKQRLGRILRPTGEIRATLYEVFCTNTKEVNRSRSRRRSDAFDDVKTFRIAEGEKFAYGRPRHRKI